MNTDNVNKWLTLAANVGVIAGIVFLGLEIEQNNDFLAAQSRAERINARLHGYELVINNPVLLKAEAENSNGLFTEEELLLLYADAVYFINMEHLWQEYEAGLLTFEDLVVEPRRSDFQGESSRTRLSWNFLKQRFHPDFVSWMDANIVDP